MTIRLPKQEDFEMNHKQHTITGLKAITVILLVSATCAALIFATPFVLAFASAVFPVLGVIALIFGVIWLLGFVVNTGKAGINKIKSR